MAESIRTGIIGAGWPGGVHARGYLNAGGFKLSAVADLIPDRRKKLMVEFGITREYADARDLVNDPEIDAVSVCLPNDLHAPTVVAALKAGKHVLCEKPPATSAAEARRMEAAAAKYRKVLMYALQRRFGGHEQAAKMAIARGLIGDVYHIRCAWTRTRGVPLGTGWYTQKARAGGGALMDVGAHLLDIGWYLLGQPRPLSVFGRAHGQILEKSADGAPCDVEDSAFALVRFDGGKTLELAASWALNQPKQQNGTVCRVHGRLGAIEVYTTQGAVVYRDFDAKGNYKENPLKPPRLVHHSAMMRHFKECILGKSTAMPGGADGLTLMRMLEGIYQSSEKGKSIAM